MTLVRPLGKEPQSEYRLSKPLGKEPQSEYRAKH